LFEQLGEVHPVELIASKDQDVLHVVRQDVTQSLPYGVRRALEPVNALWSLLGGQDVNEPLREEAKLVSLGNVTVQRCGIVLSENEDFVDPGVNTIADRYVDEPVFPTQGDRRLGANESQRKKTSTFATAQDEPQNVFHNGILAHANQQVGRFIRRKKQDLRTGYNAFQPDMLSRSGVLRNRLRDDLQELIALEGNRQLFLSAYLDVSPGSDGSRFHTVYLKRRITDLDKMFAGRGRDDKAKKLREHVAVLEKFLDTELQKDTRGVAFFLSQEIGYSKKIQLPVPLKNKVVASAAPNLDVLIELVEQNRHYCVVTLAQRSARIMSVYLTDLVRAGELTAEAPESGHRGREWSQVRFEHRARSHFKQLVKELCDALERYWQAEKPDGLVILATPENAGELRRRLTPELQRHLVASSTLPPETGADQLIGRIVTTLENAKIDQERRLSEQLYERLAGDYMAVAGLEDTLLRLQSGQLETLVVSDLFEARGRRCSRCSSLFTPEASTCLYCGSVTDDVDLRNWMEKTAERQRLRIEVLQGRSFLDNLGGVAGLLKF